MVVRAKLAIITACFFWAASFIATKIALTSIPPAGIYEMWRESFSLFSVQIEGWSALLFLGVTCSFLATLLYVYALSLSESQKVGVYLYTIPPMTQVIAFLFLNESIGTSLIGGSLIVLSGVYLTETG